MKMRVLTVFILLALTACHARDDRTHITVQRIFGECRANVPHGQAPIANPDGECEVVTGLLDAFEKENPDILLSVNIAPWPGYDQLSAQYAAGDPPDIVVMHMSTLPDFASRHLIEPLDADFKAIGLDVGNFTPAARNGVTINGQVYGMPFDNWTQLWHINMNLMTRAGLVKDGEPILPHSPEELLAQARQFKARTGLPYLLQPTDNERAALTLDLYTYLLDQKAVFFTDPRHIHIDTPQAHRVVDLFRQIYAEGLMAPGQDYPAAMAGFLNGQGGICLVGTWMIGTFNAEANTPGRPLYHGYTVKPYPMLYGSTDQIAYVDGHAWVMPRRERTPAQRAAVFRLMKFLQMHDFDWSRTGHLTTQADVAASAKYLNLPHRSEIVTLARTGETLPPGIERQFAVRDIIGDELASAITGHKTVDRALKDAENRVNDLLFHVL
ncbi:ABC transporter substrate-binding protein [Asticcacaulis sp. 201]|uniref:ABC transporter substrate-binding protein n=1 Tax=Asticcacaulis sp. 201 TaxID=3028787 RepID=UPI002916CD61|nr:extracellular solute-binding protein [Asticcacaulis sp. 201]MDV6331953.1 extracellular solute-binding protein [Asticcacaulis sp. 201]